MLSANSKVAKQQRNINMSISKTYDVITIRSHESQTVPKMSNMDQ